MGEVLRTAKEKPDGLVSLKLSPRRLGSLLGLVSKGDISTNAAKKVFDIVESQDKDPEVMVAEQGLAQISDTGELSKIVHDVVALQPEGSRPLPGGRGKAFGILCGPGYESDARQGEPERNQQTCFGIPGPRLI